MPRVALAVTREGTISVHDGTATATAVGSFRIRATIEAPGWRDPLPALLDTGAPLTIFSKAVWNPASTRGAIRWLQYDPARSTTPDQLPTTPILGVRYPYRLGVTPVVLREPAPDSGRLAPVDVTAYFVEDYPPTAAAPALKYPIILGLGLGVLADRFLVCGPGGGAEAWVQDGRPR